MNRFITRLAKIVPTIKGSLISITILLILRIGLELPIPLIDYNEIFRYEQNNLSNLNNNLSNLSIFNVNINAYINATIIVKGLMALNSKFAELTKEGLYGKRNLNNITRRLTFIIALTQSAITALSLKSVLSNWNYQLGFVITISLTTGGLIIFWLGEFITDYGIGNGPSLFVAFNLLSNSNNFLDIYYEYEDLLNPTTISLSLLVISIVVSLILFSQLCWIKIPLIASKSLNENLPKQDKAETDTVFLPIRIDVGGVFPILIAGTILYILDYIILPIESIRQIYQPLYWIIFFSLSGIFNAGLSLGTLRPKVISTDFQESAVTIENLPSKSKTLISLYLKSQIMRSAFTGSIFLSLICVLSTLFTFILPIPGLNRFGLTSLLIIINVINDTQTEVDTKSDSSKEIII